MRYFFRALAAGIAVVLLTPPAHASNAPRVNTGQGKIAGRWSTDGQVREFLGVPYAAPPVGPLRWRPPEPAKKWRGVRQATAFSAHCTQAAAHGLPDPASSEDCLTLNIWTPTRNKQDRLPVMVWIHGGGDSGVAADPSLNGERLAHKGVLVVTFSYRLGIFGFFALPQLAAESPRHAAGNYGLLDQVAALEWVRRNIAAFGGDPDQVTLFGESAGSFCVSALMASPLARGLFARAIGESGGAFASWSFPPLETSEKQDEDFAQTFFGATSLRRLRAISAADLLKAQMTQNPHASGFNPNIDGYFLNQSISAIYAAGKQAHVPLLAGWNRDEAAWVLLIPHKPTLESLHALAEKQFGPRANEFLKIYAAANDKEALRATTDFEGDKFIAYSTWAWLEAQVKTGQAPVYRYLFALGSPGGRRAGTAHHAEEINYIFGNLNVIDGGNPRPEDYKLSDLMQDYWTNFAKTGNPNGQGLPNWPVYDAGGWEVMHLDAHSRAEPDRHRDRYLFLARYFRQALTPW